MQDKVTDKFEFKRESAHMLISFESPGAVAGRTPVD